MPNFEQDLNHEKILATYLDHIYKLKGYSVERPTNMNKQHRGVDLIIQKDGQELLVDEKAQLHYLNADLPTFTFELSYLNKSGSKKKGWFLDKSKETNFYFLVTNIMLRDNLKVLRMPEDIATLKITAVSRKQLKDYLTKKGLTEKQLSDYDAEIRHKARYGRNSIKGLDSKREGLMFYTAHLQEKPMNLQLRLDFLIKAKVGKQIFP